MTALNQEQKLAMAGAQARMFAGRSVISRLGKQFLIAETVLGYIFLSLPIIILIIFSFNASRYTSHWAGFTLDWYKNLFSGASQWGVGETANGGQQFTTHGVIEAMRNSLIVASSSTAISTVLGTMIALGIQHYSFRLRRALDVLLYLPIIIPDVTMGIAMAVFFNIVFRLLNNWFNLQATLGFPTIIISHVAFNISFVSVVVRARLAGMDPALEEAAQDAGADEWQTFHRIVLPLIMPGIIGGALLAFTLSLDDFVITFFTSGVGSSTLPIFVYGMIKWTVTPAINAISTLMLTISILLVTLSLILQRKQS